MVLCGRFAIVYRTDVRKGDEMPNRLALARDVLKQAEIHTEYGQ